MKFNFLRLDPIKRFAFFMLLFAAVAIAMSLYESPEAWDPILIHLASTLGFGLVLFALFSRLSSKHKNVWDTVITCLIVFLLLNYSTPVASDESFRFIYLIYPLLTTLFALILKFFVEFRASPVVNPAAGSLLLMAAALAFIPGMDKPLIYWWGVSFGDILPYGITVSTVLMAVWVLGGFYVWKKWPIFASFLLVHALLVYLRTDSLESLKFAFMNSTTYFLVAVMLPEPKTSPLLPWKQVVYGIIAALVFNGFTYANLPYVALFAIVSANLFNAGLKWKPAPKPAMQA